MPLAARLPDFSDALIVQLRLAGHVSVDGQKPDDALENAAKGFRAPNHDTTGEGVSNVASLAGSRRLFGFVGHGTPGFISTGCGLDEAGRTPERFMALNNEAVWQPELLPLHGRARQLFLLACDAGGGRDGVRFLQAVACAAKMTAVGPTRAIATFPNGSMWLARRGEWQYVNCDGTEWRRSIGMFRKWTDRLFAGVGESRGGATRAIAGLGEVVEARYTPLAAARARERVFPGEEAMNLFASVERNPERLPRDAALLSLPTGHLLVVGDRAQRRYTVYGGVLLRDDDDPSLVYETDDSFLEKLGGWEEVIGTSLPAGRPTQTA